jgi:hypothetical protein
MLPGIRHTEFQPHSGRHLDEFFISKAGILFAGVTAPAGVVANDKGSSRSNLSEVSERYALRLRQKRRADIPVWELRSHRAVNSPVLQEKAPPPKPRQEYCEAAAGFSFGGGLLR